MLEILMHVYFKTVKQATFESISSYAKLYYKLSNNSIKSNEANVYS